MTPEHDSMPNWFWSRLWDDDCICNVDGTIDPLCINKRCRELKR